MIMKDLRDQLLDALLREELGGEHLPNLTDRILARAGGQRRRLTPRALATLAVAAVLLLVLGWLFLGQSYPEPQASGQYEVVDGGAIRRGAVLRTQDQPANLVLGGYCHVQIKPNTILRIEGQPRAEGLFLEKGELDCSVTGGQGTFTVRTDLGEVSVVGTQFQVRVFEEKGDAEMFNKHMLVGVVAGAVLVSGSWGMARLDKGQQQVFAQAKEAHAEEGKKGKTIGLLTAKGKEFIEIKADGEERARKYFPQWVGGAPAQGGGFDKHILKTFASLKVGSRLDIDWVFHERLRALHVKVLKAPPGDKTDDHAPKKDSHSQEPTGRTVGVLVSKGDKFIEVRGDGEEKARRYYARWLSGPPPGFDKNILKTFQELPVGSRLLLEWVSTNHGPQVQNLQVLKAAKK